MRQALDAGARGYVLKNAVDLELGAAIRRVAAGETVLDSQLHRPSALKGERRSASDAAGIGNSADDRATENPTRKLQPFSTSAPIPLRFIAPISWMRWASTRPPNWLFMPFATGWLIFRESPPISVWDGGLGVHFCVCRLKYWRAGAARNLPQISAWLTSPRAAGLHFRHNSGAYGGKLLPETLGAGCAFLDYDGDGWQDILLINGMDWPGHKRERSTPRLYRNNRNGTFSDVTHSAGLDIEMYGMGVAVGDYDNDGFPDILITCVGQNRLFKNTGKGTFVDVTKTSGLGGRQALQHVRAVVRFRSRRAAGFFRLQLCEMVSRTRCVLQSRRKTKIVLHAGSLSRRDLLAVSQPWQWQV